VPVRLIATGLTPLFTANDMLPEALPRAAGLNVTEKVHEVPAGSVIPQVLV